MLGRSSHDRLTLAIEHLKSLTLADRVVTENGHAVFREQDAGALIAFVRLAVVAMSAGQEHAGKRRFSFGDVKIRRDMMIGPALEDHFLDAIAVPLQRADDARIEWRSLGQVAE